MTGLATVEGHLKGGKLRALAFTSARRVPGAPDVPTLAESGYPGLEVLSWYGVLVPAGTPHDIVRKLNTDINRILQSPDVRERLTALGTSLPTIGTLQIDHMQAIVSEHSQDGISKWLRAHSSAFGSVDELDWQRGRDLPLVKFFDRVCRRFMRQHYIRDNQTDEGSALLHDSKWDEIFEILKRDDRIETLHLDAAPASARRGKFYLVVEPEKLLVPGDGVRDKVSRRIRLAVIKRAEELGERVRS